MPEERAAQEVPDQRPPWTISFLELSVEGAVEAAGQESLGLSGCEWTWPKKIIFSPFQSQEVLARG